MIEHQYNETVSTTRLVKEVGGYKQTHETHLTGISCHIQPLESSISPDIDGGFGKDFLMFCETADIQEGDRVIRPVGEGTKEYRVTSIESYDFLNQPHMEVSIRIFES